MLFWNYTLVQMVQWVGGCMLFWNCTLVQMVQWVGGCMLLGLHSGANGAVGGRLHACGTALWCRRCSGWVAACCFGPALCQVPVMLGSSYCV